MEQMPDSCRVRTTGCECFLDGLLEPRLAMLPDQLQHFDHLSGTALLPMPIHQRLPDLVKTVRPQSGPALLLQRPRSRQCAWLEVKHIKVVFEFEDLLLALITSLMPGDTAPIVPEFHHAGIDLCLHLGSSLQRHRVGVRQDFDTTQTVHSGEAR